MNVYTLNTPSYFAWKFDPSRLSDRPWRFWKSENDSGLDGPESDKYPETAEKQPTTVAIDTKSTSGRTSELTTVTLGHKSEEFAAELDAFTGSVKMRFVKPETFHYLAPSKLYEREKLYKHQLPCLNGFKRSNLLTQTYPVTVFDVAGHEKYFTLAKSGFEFAECPLAADESRDGGNLSKKYLEELEVWMRDYLGCQKVLVYQHNFRKHDRDASETDDWKASFCRAHCDATDTCLTRLQLYFPAERVDTSRDRVRFLNIWQPISTPVQDCPLALCDFRTIKPEDLVPMDIVYPHFVDEAFEVRYSHTHRWFYKKNMKRNDTIIFKLYDTDDNEASVCPHAAFVDPSAPPDSPKRESLEVKMIVVG